MQPLCEYLNKSDGFKHHNIKGVDLHLIIYAILSSAEWITFIKNKAFGTTTVSIIKANG
jgi:hypothetical protein